jgi:type I restriction enzyme R subunit
LEQINALNTELTSVRLKRRYVERYKDKNSFVCLAEQDKHDLSQNLASLVYMDDADEQAKRFDNFMYELILTQLEPSPVFKKLKNQLRNLCASMEKRATIPQIKAKLPLIQSIGGDEFWAAADPLVFEHVREELRNLIKFLSDDGKSRQIVYTNLSDELTEMKVGEPLAPQEDFEDYRLKVNRYIETNRDHIAIHKLRNNIRLSQVDYQALSDILTKELGNAYDYNRVYKNLPFGLLVRKIAKMEREAAMKAFSEFINDQALNQEQIVYVNKIVDYIVQNGYIDSPAVLVQAPFDKPQSFIKLFDDDKQKKIVELFGEIKDNAVNVGS